MIENKVAKSGLITLDLMDFIRDKELAIIDIKEQLWQGLALKEKDFREFVNTNDWSQYQGQLVGVYCSADAIIPHWAYMLLAAALKPFAQQFFFGNKNELKQKIILEAINQINPEDYVDARVIVKGCGELDLNPDAYLNLTNKLQPVVKSLMYGEPCSTVPIYKKPRN